MATTTPNYGWDVPTSTDYVKDGATAIETLGDDIDASLFSITSGKNVGLVHLNTTSFTTQSTVNVDNVFTSDYKNYRMLISVNTKSTDNAINMQFRTSGTTNTTTNYDTNFAQIESWKAAATLSGGNAGATATSFTVGFNFTNEPYTAGFDVFNPQVALKTLMSGIATGNNAGFRGFRFNGTTQFDGISLISATGTITGEIRFYGYRNS